MKKSILWFFGLLLSTPFFAQNIQLKIIETTDVHGYLLPYDFIYKKNLNHSLVHVNSYVTDLREENENLILLDNGDIIQGQPLVYYYNFINDSMEHIVSRMLNYMNYDAASVGNHDIEAGHPVYDKIVHEFQFPWLAANIIDKKSKKPYFQPYTMVVKQGVKVAVLGLITPAIPKWLPEKIWEGLEFEDMVVSASRWMPEIQKESPDVIVGLFHSGVDFTYGNQTVGTYKNENASQIVAEQVEGFDIIFVGHDHKEWNFKVKSPSCNDVLILGGGSHAQEIAQATIELSHDPASGKWQKDISGSIIKVEEFKLDSTMFHEFSGDLYEVQNFVNTPLGDVTKTIYSKYNFFGDSEFMDLIHGIQMDISGADLSFAAPMSFNTTIDSGKVSVSDMFKLYKYENLLYTMKLSGAEIKNYLEYSYDMYYNERTDSTEHLLKFMRDSNKNLMMGYGNKPRLMHPFYNFDSAEGIIYNVDVTKPHGKRIQILSMNNGNPFSLDSMYTVAINSYRGNGGGDHLVKGAGIPESELNDRVVSSTEKDIRYYMMNWMKTQKKITPDCNQNWKIIPEDWASVASKRDYELLFED